jgi:hypothetical protein
MHPMAPYVSIVLVLFGAINLGFIIAIYQSSTVRDAQFQETILNQDKWALNAACANATCQTGLAFMVDGEVAGCSLLNDPPGTSCTSSCYLENASLTCDAHQGCTSSLPSDCLGYCQIEDPYPLTYESDDPECAGKLTFRPFNSWNTDESVNNPVLDWLYYSDYPGECQPYTGCTWYGWRVIATNASSVDLLAAYTAPLGCLDFLNMTNTECIQAKAIPIDNELSTATWHNIITALGFSLGLRNRVFQTELCLFSYKCFAVNETVYSDPAMLYGYEAKRSLASTLDEDHILEVLKRGGPRHPFLKEYLQNR